MTDKIQNKSGDEKHSKFCVITVITVILLWLSVAPNTVSTNPVIKFAKNCCVIKLLPDNSFKCCHE